MNILRKKLFVSLVLLVVAALPMMWPLLQSGYYSNHDGEGHIIRLEEFDIALKDGHFPPRMDKNLMSGYGYYFFNFNYPLPYWGGELMHVLGLNYVDAIKAISILGVILSGFAMYLWQREYWNNWAAVVAAIFYMYTPYRLLTLYVRGSLAEHIAFIMLPLLFWFTERIAEGDKKKKLLYVMWGGMTYGALVLSHNITAFIFSLMLGLFMLFHVALYRNLKLLLSYFALVTTGMILSAYFFIPAMLEKGYVRLDQTIGKDYPDHFVIFYQLLQRSWGYGGSGVGANDGLSFQVGMFNWLIVFLAIPAMVYLWRRSHRRALHVLLFFGFFCLSIFFMLPMSIVLWERMPLLAFTQFPWRFLSWSTFATSVLSGMVVYVLGRIIERKKRVLYWFLTAGMVAVFIFTSRQYWQVNERVEIKLPGNNPIAGSTTWADEQFPKWFEPKPTEAPKERVEIIAGEGNVAEEAWLTAKHTYHVTATTDIKLVEHTAYYPGWQISSGGEKIEFDYQSPEFAGQMVFSVPAGEYEIISEFKETKLRLMADWVSVAGGVGVLMTTIIVEWRRGKEGL